MLLLQFSKAKRIAFSPLLVATLFLSQANSQDAAPLESPATLASVRADLVSGKNPVRIVCIGDSLTGVYYHNGSRRSWPELLSVTLKGAFPNASLKVFNAGISGDVTPGALARFEKDVLSRHPHIVTVMFGGNDSCRIPLGEYEENLEQIIKKCREANAEVILMTPNSITDNPPFLNDKVKDYAKVLERVAKRRKCPLVDNFGVWEAQRKKDATTWNLLMSDSIHPNLNGSRKMAEGVASVIVGQPTNLDPKAIVSSRDTTHSVAARLKAGQPITVVAMPPFDKIASEVISARYPQAQINLHVWPEGSEAKAFAPKVKGLNPALVVFSAAPWLEGKAKKEEIAVEFQVGLNGSFPFGRGAVDVFVAQPSVVDPKASVDPALEAIVRHSAFGKDSDVLERGKGDARSVAEILDAKLFPN
jgi:lysophospholipase L1-like esterase